jgi:hypothetical protein
MFNDLNQAAAGQPKTPVDDIFAETDKTAEAKKFSGYYPDQTQTTAANQIAPTDVETQKAGLSASEDLPTSKKGKIIKIVLIALLIILLFSLGYLVYAKFLSGKSANQNLVNSPATTTDITTDTSSNPADQTLNSTSTATSTIPVSEEVTSTPSLPVATTTPPVSNLTDTDGDGLTDQEEAVLGTDPTKKDTDGDGLTDYEEVKVYNTDPLKVDTDGDGLSDYEEVMIYHSDPLKADTNGNGFNDGVEVKNGYDPTIAGKKLTDKATTSDTLLVK